MMTSLSFFKGTGCVSRLLECVSLCLAFHEGLMVGCRLSNSHRVDHGKAVPIYAVIMTYVSM